MKDSKCPKCGTGLTGWEYLIDSFKEGVYGAHLQAICPNCFTIVLRDAEIVDERENK